MPQRSGNATPARVAAIITFLAYSSANNGKIFGVSFSSIEITKVLIFPEVISSTFETTIQLQTSMAINLNSFTALLILSSPNSASLKCKTKFIAFFSPQNDFPRFPLCSTLPRKFRQQKVSNFLWLQEKLGEENSHKFRIKSDQSQWIQWMLSLI